MALRKHLGARATPPLIEQHLLVNSWGPKPGSQACDAFVSKSVVTFMEKERRLATKGGPLVSKKDLRLPRKGALRSDKGAKRKSYIRKKTKKNKWADQSSKCSMPCSKWLGCREFGGTTRKCCPSFHLWQDEPSEKEEEGGRGGRGLVRMACGWERNGTRAEIRFEFNEARNEDLIRGEKKI